MALPVPSRLRPPPRRPHPDLQALDFPVRPHLRLSAFSLQTRRPGRSHSLARTLTAPPLRPSALLIRPALHKHLSCPPSASSCAQGGNPTPRMCAAHRAMAPGQLLTPHDFPLPPLLSIHSRPPRLPPADGSAPGSQGKWGEHGCRGLCVLSPHTHLLCVHHATCVVTVLSHFSLQQPASGLT